VAEHQQHRAEQDRLAGAEVAVGEDAADQRQQIHQRCVGAVLGARGLVVEQQMLGQVEDQDAPHAVVGEPLPHLGEEQDHQAARVIAQQLQQHRDPGGESDENPDEDDDHARPVRSLLLGASRSILPVSPWSGGREPCDGRKHKQAGALWSQARHGALIPPDRRYAP
jgi:hypothetical protein